MMGFKINGDFSKSRELMKRLRSEEVKERNKLERQIKKKQQENQYTGKLEEQLNALNKKIDMYSVSKMLPMKLENGAVVNAKLFQDFAKKLKGFVYTLEVLESSLQVKYGRQFGKWTGELNLYDISKYYEGFNDIPELEIFDFLD